MASKSGASKYAFNFAKRNSIIVVVIQRVPPIKILILLFKFQETILNILKRKSDKTDKLRPITF